MTDLNTPPPQFFVDDFLEELTQKGFMVDDERCTHLESLLFVLGPECPLNELKYTICAIFAPSVAEQPHFYRTFDAYFEGFEPEALINVTQQPQEPVFIFSYLRKGVALIIIISYLFLIAAIIGALAPPFSGIFYSFW